MTPLTNTVIGFRKAHVCILYIYYIYNIYNEIIYFSLISLLLIYFENLKFHFYFFIFKKKRTKSDKAKENVEKDNL